MADTDLALAQRLQKWADGRSTLKDVRGYSDEQLYAISRMAYFFYAQGKIEEARTLFQGLYAVDPTDASYARGLAVVEMASGNAQGALQAYDVALKVEPDDPATLVGRAEVRLSQGQRQAAVDDLRRAQGLAEPESALKQKAVALYRSLTTRR
jgi:type III secretion system low calcium response chaperone LcrH/SycD